MGAMHWPRRDCREQHPRTCVCTHTHVSHTHTHVSHTHTHTRPLPFWYQGRNQGQGTLAVLLGSVSGQQENLSKVRLQTSSAEGREVAVPSAWPHAGPSPPGPRPAGTPRGSHLWARAGGSCCGGTPRCTPSSSQRGNP